MSQAYLSKGPVEDYRRDLGTQQALKLNKNTLGDVKILYDRVIIQLDTPEERTHGGLIIPEKYQQRVTQGTVVATGDGVEHDSRKKRPMDVKPGDRVLISKHDGNDMVLDGIRFTAINIRDILGIVEEK